MTNRHCTKCGREVIADKRFCGGCGQALPVAATPIQDEPVALAEPAAPVCGQCGAALVAGKRYCKQCDNAVDEPLSEAASMVSVEVAPVSEQNVSVCRNCGAAIAMDKPFCKKCGQAVNVTAEDMPAVAAAAVQGTPAKMPEATMEIPVLTEAITATAVEEEVPYQAQLTQEDVPASRWEPVEEAVPSEAAASVAVSAPAPQDVSGNWPKAKIGLAIGIAAAVLAAAGGGWAWYAYSHRCVSCGIQSSTTTPQSTAQSGSSATSITAVQPAKPPAGTAEVAVASAPRTPPQPAPAPNQTPIRQPSSVQSGHDNLSAPTPVFSEPKAPSIASPSPPPAQARSGVLHYLGPPVPYGGKVVFDNLPDVRLQFKYDNTAWALIIKHNPDGTKWVTLISLKHGYQMNCDLGWEIIE